MDFFTKTIIALAMAFLGSAAPEADVTSPSSDVFSAYSHKQEADPTSAGTQNILSEAGRVLGKAIIVSGEISETSFSGEAYLPEEIPESEIPQELLKYTCQGCGQEVDKY